MLAAAHEVRERRAQARRPCRPRARGDAPEVWSWDITKLKGSIPYLYYSLYVILDLFSRYVVGWMVARHENAHLAERLIAATCGKQGISPDQLTIHADRGAPMRSKLVALLLSDSKEQRRLWDEEHGRAHHAITPTQRLLSSPCRKLRRGDR